MASIKGKYSSQLTLPIRLPHNTQFETFVAGENKLLFEYLKKIEPGRLFQTSVYGPTGVGKTHLLAAYTERCSQHAQSVMYIPLELLQAESPQILEGLEQCDLLALDNLDAVLGDEAWCEALFCLINRFIDKQDGHLLWSTVEPVHRLQVKLADLKSRLQAATSFKLKELNESEKKEAFLRHAHSRGLILQNDVIDFLLGRTARAMPDLMVTLDILDKASLREKRKITLPFVKQILKL